MTSLLVLGAGNIGSRHLQGLFSLSSPSRILVVDPSETSRDVAKKRWAEMGESAHSVTYHRSTAELPRDLIDLAIVATPASVRRRAFDDLVTHLNVQHVLFEKVLFQRVADYEEVENELAHRDIDSWVNCPRRLYDVYRWIHEQVGDKPIDVDVTGNGWGLGSNAVHFVDLFCWIVDSTDLEWDTSGLEDRTLVSKRDGFEEFVGQLRGEDRDGNTIALRCFEDGPMGLSVRITTPEHRWVVNETSEMVIHESVDTEGRWVTETTSVEIPYQSELTGDLAQQILETGRSDLVGFEESKAYHIPLVEALIAHLEDVRGETVEACPIT